MTANIIKLCLFGDLAAFQENGIVPKEQLPSSPTQSTFIGELNDKANAEETLVGESSPSNTNLPTSDAQTCTDENLNHVLVEKAVHRIVQKVVLWNGQRFNPLIPSIKIHIILCICSFISYL